MAEPFQSQMPIKPDQIINILFRRKWLILIPLCITLTLGLLYTLTAQRTYQASTMILVQPQRLPKDYIQPIVSSSMDERISTISQQILSRTNIEKIIDQFGLFEDEKDMYLEDKVDLMRQRVRVKVERARGGTDAFSISFTGSDPQRVMRIANTLASYFMDENLKVREAQALGTSEFLESELEKTQKRLEEREQRLAAYQTQHLGGLPDELNSNLKTLDRIQQQIANRQTLLIQVRTELSILENQIAQSREMAAQKAEQTGLDEQQPFEELTDEEQKLKGAREEYDALLLKYTAKHPDVLRLEKTIEKLETGIINDLEASGVEQSDNIETTRTKQPNLAVMQQEVQTRLLRSEIQKLESEVTNLEQQMQDYVQRVEDTPKRAMEMQALQRDYTNIQNIYNSLLKRKLEAELSMNMEKKQKGEQFRILDHARLPEKPISPNVLMLFLFSVAAGLGIGGGIVFLLEFFDNTIRSEDVIEKDLGLTLLARIPPLKKPNQKKKMVLEWGLFTCLSLYVIMFLCFFAFLNWKGLDRTINLIKSILNI